MPGNNPFPFPNPNVCTVEDPTGFDSIWNSTGFNPLQPPPLSNHYRDYIPVETYQEIQGLLPQTNILTNGKLDQITLIPTNSSPLTLSAQALGPKSDEGLINWYIENFVPIAEGSHQYLYVDSVMKISVGMGTNLADDRLKVFEYKDPKTKQPHYSTAAPAHIKKKPVSKFDPSLFIDNEEYRNAVLDKLTTVIKSFYIGDPLDIKKDRYKSHVKASRQQLSDALMYLAKRIVAEKEKRAKDPKKYRIPGAQAYVSKENAVYADKEDTDGLEREFLEKMMPALHKQVPRFSQYPAGAQLAILDMAYNTNFYRWKKGGAAKVELHPLYEQINKETIDWDAIAKAPKDPKGCVVEDLAKNFAKGGAKCSNFFFWRKLIGSTRNIATQILLLLADGW